MMTRTCSRACCSRSWSPLGFDRSYPTLVREIRELGAATGVRVLQGRAR